MHINLNLEQCPAEFLSEQELFQKKISKVNVYILYSVTLFS